MSKTVYQLEFTIKYNFRHVYLIYCNFIFGGKIRFFMSDVEWRWQVGKSFFFKNQSLFFESLVSSIYLSIRGLRFCSIPKGGLHLMGLFHFSATISFDFLSRMSARICSRFAASLFPHNFQHFWMANSRFTLALFEYMMVNFFVKLQRKNEKITINYLISLVLKFIENQKSVLPTHCSYLKNELK